MSVKRISLASSYPTLKDDTSLQEVMGGDRFLLRMLLILFGAGVISFRKLGTLPGTVVSLESVRTCMSQRTEGLEQ